METKKELHSLTSSGVEAMELTTNYLAYNLKYLVEILGSYFDGVCDFEASPQTRANAYELVGNSDKIRALVYTMGDITRDIFLNLDCVMHELSMPNDVKIAMEEELDRMKKEREYIEKCIDSLNEKLAEDFPTSRK